MSRMKLLAMSVVGFFVAMYRNSKAGLLERNKLLQSQLDDSVKEVEGLLANEKELMFSRDMFIKRFKNALQDRNNWKKKMAMAAETHAEEMSTIAEALRDTEESRKNLGDVIQVMTQDYAAITKQVDSEVKSWIKTWKKLDGSTKQQPMDYGRMKALEGCIDKMTVILSKMKKAKIQ